MTEVWLKVVGNHTDDSGEQTKIELQTLGRYYVRNNVKCFTYRESEISGMEGTTTLLKVQDQRVVLVRMGSVEVKHVFEMGKYQAGMYITPYGQMQMGVLPSHVSVALDGASGVIELEYRLDIDGQHHSINQLSITIAEAK